MKMCASSSDVRLTDGQGYFVEHGPYMQHLMMAKVTRPVRFVNHQKVNKSSKFCPFIYFRLRPALLIEQQMKRI
jgi:hypothetical protein